MLLSWRGCESFLFHSGPPTGIAGFMESDNLQLLNANQCHEPSQIPLNRPSGTFSPSGGEGWDEGVRFMDTSPTNAMREIASALAGMLGFLAMDWPVTRETLVGKSGLPSGVGWERFYAQYEGVICDFARFQGLDEHSARDVLQETIMVLIRELPGFEYNPERARFRTWLKTIVRHKTAEARRRRRDGKNISGDAVQEEGVSLFDGLADEEKSGAAEQDEEKWRRAIYEEAWRRIRSDKRVKPQNIQVFFALLSNTPVEVISEQTGLEPNAIYQVRNRMTERLDKERQEIESFWLANPKSPRAEAE
jgi:RNA polymerase sigma factor (sigma-70 family)